MNDGFVIEKVLRFYLHYANYVRYFLLSKGRNL